MDDAKPGQKKRIHVAIGIVQEGDRYLIARRPADTDLPDLWEFPGGKLEPGESPEAAAVRELQEELGLTVTPIARLAPVEHDYPHAYVILTPILCHRLAGDPQPLQAYDPRWVDLPTLQALPMPAGNATLLQELVRCRLQNPPTPAKVTPPTAGD